MTQKFKFGYKKLLITILTRVKNISLHYIQLLFKQIYFKYNLRLINNIKIILLKRIPYKKNINTTQYSTELLIIIVAYFLFIL